MLKASRRESVTDRAGSTCSYGDIAAHAIYSLLLIIFSKNEKDCKKENS